MTKSTKTSEFPQQQPTRLLNETMLSTMGQGLAMNVAVLVGILNEVSQRLNVLEELAGISHGKQSVKDMTKQ